MFWRKARKIKKLESDLDAIEKLIGSIKIQRDGASAEAKSWKEQVVAISAERDQLHQRVGELEEQVKREILARDLLAERATNLDGVSPNPNPQETPV